MEYPADHYWDARAAHCTYRLYRGSPQAVVEVAEGALRGAPGWGVSLGGVQEAVGVRQAAPAHVAGRQALVAP